MTRAATVMVDAERVSIARSLTVLARASARDNGPLVVVSHRAYADLAAELGGHDRAARRLLRIATNVGRPLAVNIPTADGSRTVVVGPKGWTQERTAGWVAARHEGLEAVFGAATVRNLEDL